MKLQLLGFIRGCLVLSALVCLMAGCSSQMPADRPLAEVSGTVSLDGKPLPDGEINFVKVAEGVNDSLPIKDGKFLGKVSIGDRKVEIRAYKEVRAGADMYGADAPLTKENYIPAKYNTDSTLKAEIKKDNPSPLEFTVTST